MHKPWNNHSNTIFASQMARGKKKRKKHSGFAIERVDKQRNAIKQNVLNVGCVLLTFGSIAADYIVYQDACQRFNA